MDTIPNNEFWAEGVAGKRLSLDDLPIDDLRQNLRLFHAAVAQSPAAMAITDGEGRFLYANPGFLKLTGYDRDDLSAKALPLTRPASDADDAMWQSLRVGKTWRGESCGQRKNGESYRESEVITPILSADNLLIGLVSVREDISSKVQDEGLKAHRSALDDLTGLLNDQAFNGAVAEYLRQCGEGGESFALILFDIDCSEKNDKRQESDKLFSREAASQQLTELAQRVRRCLRTRDMLARRSQGGFAVLLPETSLDRAEVIAERLRFNVTSSALAGGAITISLGIAGCQPDDHAGSLLARADQALYRAQKSGGNRVICSAGTQFW